MKNKHVKNDIKPPFLQWFFVVFAAVLMANIGSFLIEKMIIDRQATSSIDIEARKVLQALGGAAPSEAGASVIVNQAEKAAQQRKQLIAAKEECDSWAQKLTVENSAVNRMNMNRACQQVNIFMNKIEAGQ